MAHVEKHAWPEVLTGEFVRLRKLVISDAPITLRWRQSERASLLNRGALTLEDQERWIASRPASEINFIIETFSGVPLGMLSLVAIDLINQNAESARFLIGEEEAAKGIPAAVEAMKLLYELAFNQMGLHRIYGTVAEDNRLMIKWQKYLGMKEEGRLRQHYRIRDRFQDAVCLGLLEEEYRAVALPRLNTLLRAGKTASN